MTYLPQEEETKSNFDGGQPDGVEVNHKIHELLGICGDQVDNFAHGACSSGRTVDDQRLYTKKEKRQKRQNTFNSTEKHNSCFMFFFLSLLGVKASACSCSNIGYVMSGGLAALSHPPSCKLGPWRQSLLSFPPWSTCTCTGGWRGTEDRTVGTSRWHRSSPSTGVRPHPSWNPGGGWRKE